MGLPGVKSPYFWEACSPHENNWMVGAHLVVPERSWQWRCALEFHDSMFFLLETYPPGSKKKSSPLEMDAWKMIFPFGMPSSRARAISITVRLEPYGSGEKPMT